MMSTNRAFMGGLISVPILWLGLSAWAQGGEKFRARLSVVPIDPSTMATITGSGSVTAELVGLKLSITGTFEGLHSPATAASLHRGPTKGVRGPAVFDLTISRATKGTISGSLQLTPIQVGNLENGQFYLQINSEKAPEGNLWGWLLRESQ